MLTDGKLYRSDGTPMPLDENGLLSEVSDARYVAHMLGGELAMLYSMEVVPGMTLLQWVYGNNPLILRLTHEAFKAIHDAVCDLPETAIDVDQLGDILKQQIADILEKKDEGE